MLNVVSLQTLDGTPTASRVAFSSLQLDQVLREGNWPNHHTVLEPQNAAMGLSSAEEKPVLGEKAVWLYV